MTSQISLDQLVTKNSKTINNLDNKEMIALVDELIEETSLPKQINVPLINTMKYYQIQGIPNTKTAYIKYIGDFTDEQSPLIVLGTFPYLDFECKLYEYLTSEKHLNHVNISSILNFGYLTISKQKNIIATLVFEFNTYDNIKQKKQIQDLINSEITGFLPVYLSRKIGNYTESRYIDTIPKFPTRQNLIYTMLSYVTHKDVIKYLTK